MPLISEKLAKNAVFDSFDDLKLAVMLDNDKNKTSFVTPVSDRKNVVFKCTNKKCTYFLRGAHHVKRNLVVVTSIIPHSVCNSIDAMIRKPANRFKLLERLITPMLRLDATISAEYICKAIFERHSISSGYKPVWKAIQKKREKLAGEEADQFSLLYAYGNEFLKCNPDGDFLFSVDDENRIVRSSFLLPGSNEFLENTNQRIFLDSTFLTGIYGGQLFICCALDMNGNIRLIGFSFERTEDLECWIAFCEFLKINCPQLKKPKFQIVSDRCKGLKGAVRKVFNEALNLPCVIHLAANVGTKFGVEIKTLFKKMAATFDVSYFRRLQDQIKELNPASFAYIDDIPADTWSNAFFPSARYGATTSNPVESMNSVFKKQKNLRLHMSPYLRKAHDLIRAIRPMLE